MQNLTPVQRRWREMAAALSLCVVTVVARLSFGTIFFLLFIVLLLALFAYAIASGANQRRSATPSPAGSDRVWATDVLSRPLWIDTAASIAKWASIIFVTACLSQWNTPIWPLLESAFIAPVIMSPFLMLLAFAWASYEHRKARRILQPSAPQS